MKTAMIVVRQDEMGTVVRFELDVPGCCWYGTTQDYCVRQENDHYAVDLVASRSKCAKISVWDDSHERCAGDAMRLALPTFERDCVKTLISKFVPPCRHATVRFHGTYGNI